VNDYHLRMCLHPEDHKLDRELRAELVKSVVLLQRFLVLQAITAVISILFFAKNVLLKRWE
jgi:hypothetical protein